MEQELTGYKNQLAMYQHKMTAQLEHQQTELEQLRLEAAEVKSLRSQVRDLEEDLDERDSIVAMLERSNEELVMSVEKMEGEGFGRDRSKRDSFSDKIEAEMESMIDKLLRELKIEKKNGTKQVAEIKRLNSEMVEL